MIENLKAFERYVDYMNTNGHDDIIDSFKVNWTSLQITMRDHMGETYELDVYFSETTGELCIDNAVTKESIFDYMEFEEYEKKMKY